MPRSTSARCNTVRLLLDSGWYTYSRGKRGRSGDFGVFLVSFEGFSFQILNQMVESGPFIRTEVQEFTSETTGSGPPDDGLGNLDRGLVIGGVNLELKNRTGLYFNETANVAASNRQVAQSSFARDNVC